MIDFKNRKRLHCRMCLKQLDEPILNLPNMPLTDEFIASNNKHFKQYISDINIYQCSSCSIVQNPEDFDHDNYYLEYQYTSGYSHHTIQFMTEYANVVCQLFEKNAHKKPIKILEIGSGDGEQLLRFKSAGCSEVKGVEPSAFLADLAEQKGIKTERNLFCKDLLSEDYGSFDVCVSSYTFDHVRNPMEYLLSAHKLLTNEGIIAIEVHNLEKIINRAEYCLFEHEHTIYLTPTCARNILNIAGFEVIAIDPLPDSITRANSMIIIARKRQDDRVFEKLEFSTIPNLDKIEENIANLVSKIENYINEIPKNDPLVGFGVGGRGVMTLAALCNFSRFDAMLDSNYDNKKVLTPKTKIPVYGPSEFSKWRNANCLVFSYGYFDEIRSSLINSGFDENKIISLSAFM